MRRIIYFWGFYTILLSECLSQSYSWYTLPSAPVSNGRYDDIYFINHNTGWVVGPMGGFHGIVFRTTDGGSSWIVTDTIQNNPIRSATFINELTGWIGTLSQNFKFLKTTDGGFNWIEVGLPLPHPNGLCALFALNENFIFGSGAYCCGVPVFIKTTNGGMNWTTKDMSSYATGLVDCYFFNEDSGIVVGRLDTLTNSYRSQILFTSNGGETWERKFLGTRLTEECWKISFPSRNYGYVSLEQITPSTSKRVAKTTDGGNTWTLLDFPNAFMQGIGFVNENTGWVGTSITYGTTDGGMTWSNANFGAHINRIRFLGDTLAYAVGETIYKYSRTVSINPISSSIAHYNLQQNYPNPFNPSTKIRFGINKTGFTTVKVFDALGKEVQILISQKLNYGIYEIEWKPIGFPSGIYFYKIQSEAFFETKKMMLLK